MLLKIRAMGKISPCSVVVTMCVTYLGIHCIRSSSVEVRFGHSPEINNSHIPKC